MDTTITITPEMLGLVSVTVMIIQILKQVPIYSKVEGYTPVITVFISIGLAFATTITNPLISGIIIGAVAVLGYDAFKKQIGKKEGIK